MLAAILAMLAAGAPVSPVPPDAPRGPIHPQAPYGFLWTYKLDGRGQLVREVMPYEPREGDLVFFDDQSELWRYLYAIASTAPPFHSGLVFKKPDGSLAILEAGPDDTLHVFVMDLIPRMRTFKGIIQVRRCKKALTPEQSACLTAWAMKQHHKRYAVWRLLLQGTMIKTRGGPLRDKLAHTLYTRHRWLCAEIAVTGAELVGLLDPKQFPGSATYPLDIIDNKKHDMSGTYHEYGYWAPVPHPVSH